MFVELYRDAKILQRLKRGHGFVGQRPNATIAARACAAIRKDFISGFPHLECGDSSPRFFDLRLEARWIALNSLADPR